MSFHGVKRMLRWCTPAIRDEKLTPSSHTNTNSGYQLAYLACIQLLHQTERGADSARIRYTSRRKKRPGVPKSKKA
ncbi:hypothetical protein DPEC_G00248020 [Dallia pectoralis]|uniref:Uncharacterized protein n=1 Tax=Dallia pectoralis TaxID=75939 RepID=A0ACC2FWE5_DALPE|nr:hypothetical protein DPEC_G00248020 [Dallia pectoralis]